MKKQLQIALLTSIGLLAVGTIPKFVDADDIPFDPRQQILVKVLTIEKSTNVKNKSIVKKDKFTRSIKIEKKSANDSVISKQNTNIQNNEKTEQDSNNKEETSLPKTPPQTFAQQATVHEQFIKSGGTQAMWDYIVIPESSGNPDAVGVIGERGLGQTLNSWGVGSVEDQTAGMLQYAMLRYGSIDNAIQFRINHGWW